MFSSLSVCCLSLFLLSVQEQRRKGRGYKGGGVTQEIAEGVREGVREVLSN